MSKELKAAPETDTCTQMSVAPLFTISQRRNTHMYPSTEKRIGKMRCTYEREHYSSHQRDEEFCGNGINRASNVSAVVAQSQKAKYCVIAYHLHKMPTVGELMERLY